MLFNPNKTWIVSETFCLFQIFTLTLHVPNYAKKA